MSERKIKGAAFYEGESGKSYHERKHVILRRAYNIVSKIRSGKIQSRIVSLSSVLEWGVSAGWNVAGLSLSN
jgi:hypothetical protein